jgi:16S rRNA (uracil1498-N3)-methyltransferase
VTEAAKPKVRLHVSGDLAPGVRLDLERAQSHYLAHVMRLGPGAEIAVFNGRDGEWRARVAAARKGAVALEVADRLRPQAASPDVWLVFAPVKRAPIDFVAAKATELGVRVLCPVVTRHTVVTRVNVERVRTNAIEAAEQCGRLDVPEVCEPEALETLLARWPAERRLLVCDETGGGIPFAVALAGERPGAPWAILVGPEGSFAAAELDAIRKLTFSESVSLGPRILRAETAAVAALACWQALLGDWRSADRE